MKLFLSFGWLITISSLAAAQTTAPAEPRPVTDEYFGIKVVDPYRHLENISDPPVAAWMKSQSEIARSTLDGIPAPAELLADIEKFVNAAPAQVSEVHRRAAGDYFYLKTLAEQSVAKLYRRHEGNDELLVDTDKFAGPHGEPPAINYFEPSDDARHVAYGVSVGGSEDAVIHIVDTRSKKDLAETIDRGEFGSVCWRNDNQSFFYNRLQKLEAGMPQTEKFLRSKIYLHRLCVDLE